MHKTFISYHHDNEQELKEELIKYFDAEDFIDASVGDGEIDTNLDEEEIMRIIRDDYLHDSTVTLVLVGWETSQRPYVNSEIQASLRDTTKNKHNGLLAVIRDEVYDCIYSSGTCQCGCRVRSENSDYYCRYVPNLVRKNHEHHGKCHYNDTEVYCSIVKYSTFKSDPEKYVNEAFNKRDDSSIEIKKIPDPGTPGIGK